MYKIIGADQREYGPITSEQIRQWIAQGRVDAQTKVLVGADWKPLAEVPEFADALRPQTPPLTTTQATPQPTAPVKTSGLAITSLVCGILGLFTCGITALVGLILGIISMVKIKNSQGRVRGFGLAVSGTVVSGVFVLMLPLFAAMLLPALAKAKQKAQTLQCMNNLKQITLAAHMYADSHGDKFPPAESWCDALQQSGATERTLKCVAAARDSRCDYAINRQVAGMQLNQIRSPMNTVLFFESDGGWNASSGAEMVASPLRHNRTTCVGFVDGHVEVVTEQRLNELRWEP